MYVYTYTCTLTYLCINVCTYICLCIYICMYMHLYVFTCLYVCMCCLHNGLIVSNMSHVFVGYGRRTSCLAHRHWS